MTTVQIALNLSPLVEPDYTPDLTIQQRYELWRDVNPWVLPTLAELLDDWSAHGGKRVGVKAAVEWLRWHYNRATFGDAWKWNNTHTSRLARDLVERYPYLADVIETRRLRTP